jgi:hypothetical protein
MGQVNKGANRRAESSAVKRRAVSAIKYNMGGCVDCGAKPDNPADLHFDHLPGFEKVNNISDMVSEDQSWAVIRAEMAKCQILCRECHVAVTRERKAAEAGTRAERAAALGLEDAPESADSLEAVMADLADIYWRLYEIQGGE